MEILLRRTGPVLVFCLPHRNAGAQQLLDDADDQVERAVKARRQGVLAAYRDAAMFKVVYGWGLFSGGQDPDKRGVFTDHPRRTMINYSPPPHEVLHMWRVRPGQASDQQR